MLLEDSARLLTLCPNLPGPRACSSTSTTSAAANYTWPASRHPTPYEVLAHPKHARYNKALFYELVKIYHPDRNQMAGGSPVPHSVRLERYRLVVAANQILSDDAKRRAYDLCGAGWDGSPSMQNLHRESDRSWRNAPGNPSKNATWEDWESWRREKNSETPPQTPVYMSNELFVFVLCSFAIVGGLAHVRHARADGLNVVNMRDQKHAAITDEMRRRENEVALLSRHDRVENFLRQRDGWIIASSKTGNIKPTP
ncbi:hypothetical protein F4777DRAFT_591155 [Nemania sp. FL0916]|nr:hypothetical protein F4777DRAFT_591155 [Nemania sp. FL0916]